MSGAGEKHLSVIDVEESEPTVITDGEEQSFGRYHLRFEIATGGMASVYLASVRGPAGFEKLVALKRIHPHLAKQPQFVEMFLDEARIASRIQHPNVCGVIDFGESNGTYYLAMDYLVGEPVSKVVRAAAKDPALGSSARLPAIAARIIADACEGLHAAHEVKDSNGRLLNVVHRDVSPHNIFVTYDGAVRIVDFGVASADNRLHETSTGTVKGKFAYMSPEQVRGADPDRRMDVWSLGVVLFEMLTQKRLFRRKSEAETISAVGLDPVPAPSELNANVPPALDAIVLRAVNRDVDQRYATARDMGRDLLRFLGNEAEPVGMSDLSDWMDIAFPDGRARKMQLVSIARQAEPVPKMLDDASGESSSALPQVSAVKKRVAQPPSRVLTPRVLMVGALALVLGGVLVGVAMVRLTSSGATEDSERSEASLIAEARAGSSEAEGPEEPAGPEAGATEATAPTQTEPPTGRGARLAPSAPEVEAPAVAVAVTRTPEQEPEAATPEGADEPDATEATPAARPAESPSPRPRMTPAPQPQAVGQGQINLVTPGGWAIVFFRGRRIGQTPGQFTLPAGTHSLEIQPFGEGARRRIRVNVVAGTTRRVSQRVSG